MLLLLALAIQSAQIDPGAATFDLHTPRRSVDLTAGGRCREEGSSDEVVVCGGRRGQYRLPLADERRTTTDRGAPNGMAALTPSGGCGIFSGERHCSKSEASEYGYGRGRDPLSVLTGLARKVADPDAN